MTEFCFLPFLIILGKILVTQIVPIHPAVLEIPGRSALSQATHELIFQAEDVPPLGYKSYYVSHDSSASHNLHVTVSSDQHMSNDVSCTYFT